MTSNEKQRTIQQNKAMHKGFDLLSDKLNELGFYKKLVLEAFGETWWTAHGVKEDLFKPVAKAMFGHDSTADLTTDQVTKVWDQIMVVIGEKFGVYLPFPSIEETEEYLNSYEKAQTKN